MGYVTHYKNGFQADEVNAFSDMLFVDTLRGWDATGAFSVDNKQNVAIVKAALEGPTFIRQKEFVDFAKDAVARGSFLVGHNRAATKGAADKDENAHPFCVDDKIVLVQNGSYHGNNWKHLADTEVDSEAIAHVLAREPDIAAALQQVNAAYALVWYDVPNSTLHIIRNNLRPLYVCKPKRGGLMFASEATTIVYAASRQGIPLEAYPTELKAGNLISIKLELGGGWKMEETPIDYMYKSVSGTWHQSDEEAYEAYMAAAGKYFGRQQQHPNYNRHTFHLAADVSYTFRQVAIDQRKYWMNSTQQAQAAEWHKSYKGKRIIVEVDDFFPANERRDCKAWFIVLKPVELTRDDAVTPLFYWVVKDLPDVEVLEYVNTIYWEGDMGEALIEGNFMAEGKQQFLSYCPMANYKELTSVSVEHAH